MNRRAAAIVALAALGLLAILPAAAQPRFLATLRDPEFLADARQARLDVDPVGSEELERLIEDLLRLEPPLAARLGEMLR